MKTLLSLLLLSLPAFSQVTSIASSDKLKDSRAVINTNFSNLQTNKQDVNYAAESGAADVYVVTLSPALASLADGSLVNFKASATNTTTTPTLNVNGLGAKVIKKQQNVALAASDIVTNGMVSVRYNTDCTCWQMLSQPGTAPSGSGTVTGSSLTSNHVIKGGGSAAIAVSGCTIDSSDNMVCPGSVTSGSSGGTTGAIDIVATTSGKIMTLTTADSLAADQTVTLGPTTFYRAISCGFYAAAGLATSTVCYVTVPFACTIAAWNMQLDAGTATIDVWKVATGTAHAAVGNTITASALPAISTGTAKRSTTLTSWTTTVAVNDMFAFNINAVATATSIGITLECRQ